MELITKTHIEQLFNDVKEELLRDFPIADWYTKPAGLHWTKHKTKYGMASHIGNVYINKAFISTTAWHLLEATIRHEFAHLYIGLAAGHNISFKKTAVNFKSLFSSVPVEEVNQIQYKIGYQYKLYAVFENGDSVCIKKVHRKHAKYLKYKPKLFYYLSIKGQRIIRFDYFKSR